MEKKNKIAISIFAVVCVISTIVGYIIMKQGNNKYGQLAVMVKQDDGSFVRSTMSAFGNDDYEFDHAVCSNGSTVTANTNVGINLKLLGTDKCTVYLKLKEMPKLTDLQAFKDYARTSTSTMYQSEEPQNVINSVEDDNFSQAQQTYTMDITHQSYYMTYADAYTFHVPTTDRLGSNYPTFSLTNAQVGKYSDIYSSLAGKYIVNYEGHNLSTAATYETNGSWNSSLETWDKAGIDRIYKVVSATATSITYIPSSYTIEFANNGTTGIYTAEDDYGTSYYFRGNVTNNYVKFGKWTEEIYRGYDSSQRYYKEFFTKEECTKEGKYSYGNGCNKSPVAGKDMYWRIIRINGDGSLRLMYDGTEAYANGTRNRDRFALPYQKFNKNYSSNAYVGYMYGDINGTTYDAIHANTNDSTIKTVLETWYEKNFVGTEYESKIGDMSFCNDRSLSSGTGIGGTSAKYSAYERLITNKRPSLVCLQKNDLFTKNDISKGNGKLKYPIGLLTADEASLAGGIYGSYNRGYYMNKGDDYLLASAHSYSYANVFSVHYHGYLSNNDVSTDKGAVPVINIPREYVETMSGDGTMENPYIITGDLPDGYYSVSFDAGEYDYLVPKIVKEGETYGDLPVPNTPPAVVYPTYEKHYYFNNWRTGSNCSGTVITSSTIVNSSANGQILYPCYGNRIINTDVA